MWRFLLYGFLGLLLEVAMGAVVKIFSGDFNLRGSTSLWMIFDYGLFGLLLMPIKKLLERLKAPLPVRAVVYMLLIYFVEYVSGTLFTAMGLRIWDYSGHRYQLNGHISLVYAPLWYCLGMYAEVIYNKINACANALANG